MIHLSSYHSNGLPTLVWTNKVNLIGEKVYKPRIHFCEHCNKPILLYGRLIPCKHVFCYTCALLCLNQSQTNDSNASANPSTPGPNEQPPNVSNHPIQSPQDNDRSDKSPGDGCHRCGGKTLRVERNTLNSIFVCQVETCKRTYLSARDLQAHINHRHSKTKSSSNVANASASSASMAAISSSPYISSSTFMHLNSSHNDQQTPSSDHRTTSGPYASNSNSNNTNNNNNSNNNTTNNSNSTNNPRHNSPNAHHRRRGISRDKDRRRHRHRGRDNKDHRQSMQRAAQWAEASANIIDKGYNK